MRKIIFILLLCLLFIPNVYSQSFVVLDQSNSFEYITEKIQSIAKEISASYNYFDSGMEINFTPVLDNDNKEKIKDNKFVILWFSTDLIDINLLFLCNMEAQEAIIFNYCDEYSEGYYECTLLQMSRHLMTHIIRVYNDPKWYVKREG